MVVGDDLEGGAFWQGLNVRSVARGDRSWLDQAAVVVQPALIEEQPRALLAALAAGVPVIASGSCGIPPQRVIPGPVSWRASANSSSPSSPRPWKE